MKASAPPEPGVGAARPPALRALDASMGLLREIELHPLDPDYELAASRRRPGATPLRRRLATGLLTAGLAGITVAGILALRAPDPDGERARADLVARIEALTEKVAVADRENAAMRRAGADAEAAVLSSSRVEDLARWEAMAAQRAVAGPGVAMTLDDAPGSRERLPADGPVAPEDGEGLVQDRDLQSVVNSWWAAGAEAIAVNGQRLTTTSAIRSAGSAVLVDFRPLSPPYLVHVIGDPAGLQSAFAAGDGGDYTQYLQNNFGIVVTLEASDRLRVPAARAAVLHYARPVTSDATSTPSPSKDVP